MTTIAMIANQSDADWLIPDLLTRPGKHVIRCNLTGPVYLRRIKVPGGVTCALGGWYGEGGPRLYRVEIESSADPAWALAIRADCEAAGVACP